MKKNILPFLVEEFLKRNPNLSNSDLYSALKMSRQNFFQHLTPEREISLSKLCKFRKAMQIPKKDFWLLISKFYDKE